jgi:hypothetical protein
LCNNLCIAGGTRQMTTTFGEFLCKNLWCVGNWPGDVPHLLGAPVYTKKQSKSFTAYIIKYKGFSRTAHPHKICFIPMTGMYIGFYCMDIR